MDHADVIELKRRLLEREKEANTVSPTQSKIERDYFEQELLVLNNKYIISLQENEKLSSDNELYYQQLQDKEKTIASLIREKHELERFASTQNEPVIKKTIVDQIPPLIQVKRTSLIQRQALMAKRNSIKEAGKSQS